MKQLGKVLLVGCVTCGMEGLKLFLKARRIMLNGWLSFAGVARLVQEWHMLMCFMKSMQVSFKTFRSEMVTDQAVCGSG